MLVPVFAMPLDHPLLGEKFKKLKTNDEKTQQQVMAELLLDLTVAPTDATKVDQLIIALTRQINFQLEAGVSPEVMKSVANAHPGNGNTTTYRDRFLEPGAVLIVARVMRRAQPAFRVPEYGT
jgi:hypothetical protein